MAILSIATILGTAGGLANIGYQASQGTPATPNVGAASQKAAQAAAAALPIQRQLAAAEQMGRPSGTGVGYKVKVPKQSEIKSWSNPKSKNYQAYLSYNGDFSKVYMDGKGGLIDKNLAEPNFTGYGTADIEGKLANQMANVSIGLGQKYGTQFAQEAAREAALADPEGTQARAIENELIQKQISNPPPVSPLAGTLNEQVGQQLAAGSGFDPMTRELLDSAVARANLDRGGGGSPEQVATALSTGQAGFERQQAAQAKAGGFLGSGSTPEDIAYRREQQNLANLGAFVGGRTPESQFVNLSGASQGATPMTGGQQLPGMSGAAGAAAGPYSVSGYQAQLRAREGQANPWTAGISGLLSAAGAANSIVGG